MSFTKIDQTLQAQGKIAFKNVSLVPHIQETPYQADILVPYNTTDPASDRGCHDLHTLAQLTCPRLDLLRENVTEAYKFRTFHYHKFIEHENSTKPTTFTIENGRLVDHEPELIDMSPWDNRRQRYARYRDLTDGATQSTAVWDAYAKVEITLMLRQIILMDIEEREIKMAKIAAARKAEYEDHLENPPQERRVSIDEDEKELKRAFSRATRVVEEMSGRYPGCSKR